MLYPHWNILNIWFLDVVCEEHEFKCDNYKCIHAAAKCDGNDDCGDNSDETDECHGNFIIWIWIGGLIREGWVSLQNMVIIIPFYRS